MVSVWLSTETRIGQSVKPADETRKRYLFPASTLNTSVGVAPANVLCLPLPLINRLSALFLPVSQ